MQVKRTNKSDTEVTLTISVDGTYIAPIKVVVLKRLAKVVRLPGFRQDKAPLNLVEKNINQTQLQSEVMQAVIEAMYEEAVKSEKLRTTAFPKISLKKFVPFTTLEIEAELEVVGKITLPGYTKIKLAMPKATVTKAEIDDVIESLRVRLAEKKLVERAAKDEDEVWIDFAGTDAKGEPVKGADGKDYPLALGSNTFIPGFETNVVGMKAKDKKSFVLTFPKDYQLKALANKKVTFEVTVNKVNEVVKPEVNTEFVAKVGPFKTVEELRADIERELTHQRQHDIRRQYESDLLKLILAKTKVNVPKGLIDNEIENLLRDLKQNLSYRGQTYQEFLESEGKTEESYKEDVLKPQATERVKGGLVLAEISNKEDLNVTPEELEANLTALRQQHQQDHQMLEQLDKPETRQEVASQVLTAKTLDKLVAYSS